MPRCYMIKKCPPSLGKLNLIRKSGSATIVKIQVVKPVTHQVLIGGHQLMAKGNRKLPELPVLIPLKTVESSNPPVDSQEKSSSLSGKNFI